MTPSRTFYHTNRREIKEEQEALEDTVNFSLCSQAGVHCGGPLPAKLRKIAFSDVSVNRYDGEAFNLADGTAPARLPLHVPMNDPSLLGRYIVCHSRLSSAKRSGQLISETCSIWPSC